MSKLKILSVFGTRPEAIKMLPLVLSLSKENHIESKVCVTGQHREMLDQVLELFSIIPDFDLNLMQANQDLTDLSARLLQALKPVLHEYQPNLVLVHGDTTTSFIATLACYYQQIPVAHIEAGLRTQNIYSPWPEEGNRCLTACLATLHFAPTASARKNLLAENVVNEKIFVTGNTVIDALLFIKERLQHDESVQTRLHSLYPDLDLTKQILLVTSHRRENFGAGFKNICQGLKQVAEKYSELQIVYPVHMNPNVRNVVEQELTGISNIFLLPPQEYLSFVNLMVHSTIILTDSGGIQEEAPSLGKPVLVMRNVSERPEAIEAGTVKLIGTNPQTMVDEVSHLLNDQDYYKSMVQIDNPYGDGHACERIIKVINAFFESDFYDKAI